MAMFASGVTTFIQFYPLGKIGARSPIVVGFQYKIPSNLGAALVESLVEIALGFSMPYILKFFPPIVTGIVVLAIEFGFAGLATTVDSFATAALLVFALNLLLNHLLPFIKQYLANRKAA